MRARGVTALRTLVLIPALLFASTGAHSESGPVESLLAIQGESDPDLGFKYNLLQWWESRTSGSDPLMVALENAVAQALFESRSRREFDRRLGLLHSVHREAARVKPEEAGRFNRLDAALRRTWDELPKQNRTARIVSEVGTGIAAGVIAYWVGGAILRRAELSSRWIYLVVPASILAGGSIGYLGARFFDTRGYTYDGLDLNAPIGLVDAQETIRQLKRLREGRAR